MTELLSPNIIISVVDAFRIIAAAVIAGGGGYLIHLLHKSLNPIKKRRGTGSYHDPRV